MPKQDLPQYGFSIKLSHLILGERCPRCKAMKMFELDNEHKDSQGQILFWDASCFYCGNEGRVINDQDVKPFPKMQPKLSGRLPRL